MARNAEASSIRRGHRKSEQRVGDLVAGFEARDSTANNPSNNANEAMHHCWQEDQHQQLHHHEVPISVCQHHQDQLKPQVHIHEGPLSQLNQVHQKGPIHQTSQVHCKESTRRLPIHHSEGPSRQFCPVHNCEGSSHQLGQVDHHEGPTRGQQVHHHAQQDLCGQDLDESLVRLLRERILQICFGECRSTFAPLNKCCLDVADSSSLLNLDL